MNVDGSILQQNGGPEEHEVDRGTTIKWQRFARETAEYAAV